MPLNERKVITIILDECKNIEERCDGYKEMLVNAITEIIAAERQHSVQGTYIQQKINDQCYAAGHLLADKRGQTKMTEEDLR